jgi:hypothetical protein
MKQAAATPDRRTEMSFYHMHTYHTESLRHAELMARAEVERQLNAIRPASPSLIAHIRIVVGKVLISAGETLARPAHIPGRM